MDHPIGGGERVELVVAWRELLWLMVGSGRPDLLFTHKWMHFVNKVSSA
jgi:hypothetical protein